MFYFVNCLRFESATAFFYFAVGFGEYAGRAVCCCATATAVERVHGSF